MKSPELLAPAGSMETLRAALRAGADAVYVGGKRFSARSSASNFTDEELAEAARLCHKYGAKLDLAVNTIISDGEAEEFCSYIKYTASVGIDAYIVQDWGCADIIRKAVPDAVIHASTQMSVHTAAGAAMLAELGYSRVVPARELDKNVLRRICREDIEVEVFVHGALCMSVSGQCYMSAMMGSRSANRGCCGQACRLPFSARGYRSAAALSLKDLSLLPNARELAEIGVDSFKIEGRMKRPEYVASAVSELKKSLSGEAPDMELLKGVFSREGFTDGYFTGKRTGMFGVRQKEDVTAARTLIPKIHELYRFERKAYTVDFHTVIKEGQPVTLSAAAGKCAVTVTGDVPEKAVNRPADLQMLAKQLSKLGDTVFAPGAVTAEIGEGLTLPASRLNDMRRNAAEQLTELIIAENTPKYTITDYTPSLPEKRKCGFDKKMPLRTLCRTKEQAIAAAQDSEFLIIPEKLIDEELVRKLPSGSIIASPPRFISDEDKLISRLEQLRKLGISRIFCHTPDHIAIGKKLGFTLHGSFTLNVYNSFCAARLSQIGLEDCIFSIEGTLPQLEKLSAAIPVGAVIYGRLPLMLTRNCPIKNEVGCKNCTHSLTDRTGRRLPVLCSGEYVEILNSDCLCMTDRLGEVKNASFGLVILHDEDGAGTRDILRGKKPETPVTRGLYYRGIG